MNPAQFAPHEDLATYPRTLPHDLQVLSSLSASVSRSEGSTDIVNSPSAVFVPSVRDMYPSGITQNISEQKGTFVEVKGYGHQMEGSKRPDFFRGVATVVIKLFNVIEVRDLVISLHSIDLELIMRTLSRPKRILGKRISNRHSFFRSLREICFYRTQHPKTCILFQLHGSVI